MTFGRLLRYNLFYHWRGNLAVLLGVAVGTAVLTGALLVGDSLRGSLRDLVEDQLGWVDDALVTGRFFRQDLATELGAERFSPAILLQGTASSTSAAHEKSGRQVVHRAGRAMILGVDDRFWSNGRNQPSGITKEEAVLNAASAEELGVTAGDTITLHVQKVSAIPRETLLGQRDAAEV